MVGDGRGFGVADGVGTSGGVWTGLDVVGVAVAVVTSSGVGTGFAVVVPVVVTAACRAVAFVGAVCDEQPFPVGVAAARGVGAPVLAGVQVTTLGIVAESSVAATAGVNVVPMRAALSTRAESKRVAGIRISFRSFRHRRRVGMVRLTCIGGTGRPPGHRILTAAGRDDRPEFDCASLATSLEPDETKTLFGAIQTEKGRYALSVARIGLDLGAHSPATACRWPGVGLRTNGAWQTRTRAAMGLRVQVPTAVSAT